MVSAFGGVLPQPGAHRPCPLLNRGFTAHRHAGPSPGCHGEGPAGQQEPVPGGQERQTQLPEAGPQTWPRSQPHLLRSSSPSVHPSVRPRSRAACRLGPMVLAVGPGPQASGGCLAETSCRLLQMGAAGQVALPCGARALAPQSTSPLPSQSRPGAASFSRQSSTPLRPGARNGVVTFLRGGCPRALLPHRPSHRNRKLWDPARGPPTPDTELTREGGVGRPSGPSQHPSVRHACYLVRTRVRVPRQPRRVAESGSPRGEGTAQMHSG